MRILGGEAPGEKLHLHVRLNPMCDLPSMGA